MYNNQDNKRYPYRPNKNGPTKIIFLLIINCYSHKKCLFIAKKRGTWKNTTQFLFLFKRMANLVSNILGHTLYNDDTSSVDDISYNSLSRLSPRKLLNEEPEDGFSPEMVEYLQNAVQFFRKHVELLIPNNLVKKLESLITAMKLYVVLSFICSTYILANH